MKSDTPTPEARFTAVLERSDNKLWGCHFEVPAKIVRRLSADGSRRVRCRLNEGAEYQCAMLPHGNGTFVITVNKALRDSLGLTYGAEVQVALHRDESRYGLPMPEEFNELLEQDEAGSALFHALTPGKQRTLLYIINGAKREDRRVSRALTVIRHLKRNKGKIDFRQLTADMKANHDA